MSTALDQINGALRLLGVLAEGESPSAETAQDSLTALNQMLDSWSIERLAVYSTQDQVFTWPSNEITRTIGPTGDFVGNRPVRVDDSTYFRDAATGVSYQVTLINQQQYDAIPMKTASASNPSVLFVNNTHPDLTLTVYPKPSMSLEWHIVSVNELAQVANLSTSLSFPPGYLRAFRYNLAMELAPEFGVEPSRQVARIAMTSKRNLKRINNPDNVMSLPYAITSKRRFNIYSGE